MKMIGLESTLNLIVLSDAFRRHASFPDFLGTRTMVDETRKIAVLCTHYRPEYPDLPENKIIDRQIAESVQTIAAMAADMGVDRVVLPLSGDPRSWVAGRVRSHVLKDMDTPLRFALQRGVYNTDMSKIGKIDKRIRTALDEGVRGVMNINQNLKYKWDR